MFIFSVRLADNFFERSDVSIMMAMVFLKHFVSVGADLVSKWNQRNGPEKNPDDILFLLCFW